MAKLFYVIGASGAGKDSLLQYARENMPGNAAVIFAHRYITRAANACGENHIALTVSEFKQRKLQDCFAMSWYSHDTYYGIGLEINIWLSQGLDVVVNGSRAYLAEASETFSNLVPIFIGVDPKVLYQRLLTRGRENQEQIEKRLKQAIELEKEVQHPELLKIENNALLPEAGRQFLNIILYQLNEKCA